MLAEFEKRVAFALIQFLQPEKILIEFDRLFDVAYFNGDVITAVDLHAHDLHSRDIRLLRAACAEEFKRGEPEMPVLVKLPAEYGIESLSGPPS